MLPMKEISLAPGVTLRTVQTQKFKTSIPVSYTHLKLPTSN